ncbi:MAG: hypothetical protein ACRC35_13080 [Angustibacter sp.]
MPFPGTSASRGLPGTTPAATLARELHTLRATRPALTNSTIARRAEALKPPSARWRVTDRRLGEWLSGQSVPHSVDALIAVVTVLTECADGVGPATRNRRSLAEADHARWVTLWRRARSSSVEPGPAHPTKSNPPPTAVLGPRPLTGDQRRLLDRLSTEVNAYVGALAAQAVLLVPTPLSLTWRRRQANARPLATDHLLFGPLPGAGRAPAHTEGGRPELYDLYAAQGSGRLLVLGDIGAGKTSTAVMLTLEALARRESMAEPGRSATPVPVYLRLPTWEVPGHDLTGWVCAELARALPGFCDETGRRAIRSLLDAGALSLVLDGLDEVDDIGRPAVLRAVVREARTRVVLFGRPCVVGPTVSCGLGSVTTIDLQAPSPDAVRTYLANCFGGTLPAALSDGALPAVTASPLGVALLREQLVQDPAAARQLGGDAQPVEALADLALRQAFPPRGPGRDAALPFLSRLARSLQQSGTLDFDWWRLPGLVAPRWSFAAACGTATAAGVAVVHLLAAWAHQLTSDRAPSFTYGCPDFTWQGRLAHDLGTGLAYAAGLGWAVALAVFLRHPAPVRRRRSLTARTLPGHVAQVVTAAGALGAVTAGTLWLIMSMTLTLGRQLTVHDWCSVSPGSISTAGLTAVGVQGGALGAILGLAVVGLVRAGYGRRREPLDVAQLWSDTARGVLSAGSAGGLLTLALVRRAAGDGYTPAFLPRPGLPTWVDQAVAGVDGLVMGMDLGLTVGVALALVTITLTTSDALRGSGGRTAGSWRWRPTVHLQPSAIVLPLVVGPLLVAGVLVSVGFGSWFTWVGTVVVVPIAVTAFVRRRDPRPRSSLLSPAEVLQADRRFAIAVLGLGMVVFTPAYVDALMSPTSGLVVGQGRPDGIRLLCCVLVTTILSLAGMCWAVTAEPHLRICAAMLGRRSGRVDPIAAVVHAYDERIIRCVSTGFTFRHSSFADQLATLTKS